MCVCNDRIMWSCILYSEAHCLIQHGIGWVKGNQGTAELLYCSSLSWQESCHLKHTQIWVCSYLSLLENRANLYYQFYYQLKVGKGLILLAANCIILYLSWKEESCCLNVTINFFPMEHKQHFWGNLNYKPSL